MAYTLRQINAYTLADSVAAQKLFDANTTGAIDLVPGFYEFEFSVAISSMSATSGNGLIDIKGAGTATLARVQWCQSGNDQNVGTVAAFLSGGFNVTAASATPVVVAGVGTALIITGKGSFDCTVAGTLIPAITLTTGGVTPSVNAGSFVKVALKNQATGQAIMSDEGYRTILSDVTVGSTRTVTFSDGTVRVDKL